MAPLQLPISNSELTRPSDLLKIWEEAHSIEALIGNLQTQFRVERGIPLTLNTAEYENAFIASPYTQNILYALEELSSLRQPGLEKFLSLLIKPLARFFRESHLNRVVQINNWLLTTNPFSRSLLDRLPELVRDLEKEFPEHSLIFRDLPDDPLVLDEFRQSGFLLQKQRRVYFFDGISGDYLRKEPLKRDLKWMRDQGFRIVSHEDLLSEAPRIHFFYQSLYRKKHSRWNPDYSLKFVEECLKTKALEFHGLLNREGELKGVVGFFARSDLLVVPFLGYDTEKDEEEGLYRMLAAHSFVEAHRRKILLNYSSGAGEFKRRRGGKPQWSYTAVRIEHLRSLRQKAAWRTLIFLANHLAAPLMESKSL